MTFYNDFTPFTTAAYALAMLALASIIMLRHTGAMTPLKRTACEVLLILALAAVIALTVASWPFWSFLLGPVLAAVSSLIMVGLVSLELARTHRVAVAERSQR